MNEDELREMLFRGFSCTIPIDHGSSYFPDQCKKQKKQKPISQYETDYNSAILELDALFPGIEKY